MNPIKGFGLLNAKEITQKLAKNHKTLINQNKRSLVEELERDISEYLRQYRLLVKMRNLISIHTDDQTRVDTYYDELSSAIARTQLSKRVKKLWQKHLDNHYQTDLKPMLFDDFIVVHIKLFQQLIDANPEMADISFFHHFFDFNPRLFVDNEINSQYVEGAKNFFMNTKEHIFGCEIKLKGTWYAAEKNMKTGKWIMEKKSEDFCTYDSVLSILINNSPDDLLMSS